MARKLKEILHEGSVYTLTKFAENAVRFHDRGMISAGDGERYEHINGLDVLRAQQTCLAMNYLKLCRVPIAFSYAYTEWGMVCPLVKMIPLEVVVRGALIGSYLKRHPTQKPQWVVGPPKVEFFHKQTYDRRTGTMIDGNDLRQLGPDEVKRLKEEGLVFPDPLILFQENTWSLHDAKAPLDSTSPLVYITPVCSHEEVQKIHELAKQAFTLLSEALRRVNGRLLGIADDCRTLALADIKFEFGYRVDTGELVLADVVNLDSMRLIVNRDLGPTMRHISKQVFREGALKTDVLKVYQQGLSAFKQAFKA